MKLDLAKRELENGVDSLVMYRASTPTRFIRFVNGEYVNFPKGKRIEFKASDKVARDWEITKLGHE